MTAAHLRLQALASMLALDLRNGRSVHAGSPDAHALLLAADDAAAADVGELMVPTESSETEPLAARDGASIGARRAVKHIHAAMTEMQYLDQQRSDETIKLVELLETFCRNYRATRSS